MEFTWWGHACLEVHGAADQTILFDPWFGNPRSSKRADQVERCDLLLVTHGHSDHFDPDDALGIASRTRPAWPCIHELSLWLGRNLRDGSERVIGMNKAAAWRRPAAE